MHCFHNNSSASHFSCRLHRVPDPNSQGIFHEKFSRTNGTEYSVVQLKSTTCISVNSRQPLSRYSEPQCKENKATQVKERVRERERLSGSE